MARSVTRGTRAVLVLVLTAGLVAMFAAGRVLGAGGPRSPGFRSAITVPLDPNATVDGEERELFRIGSSSVSAKCNLDPGPVLEVVFRVTAGPDGAVIRSENQGSVVIGANGKEPFHAEGLSGVDYATGATGGSYAVLDRGGTAASGTYAMMVDVDIPGAERCVATIQAAG